METVRDWASRKGYDYRFYDDELFDRLPEWFKARVEHQILPMSDLARLVIAGELLEERYERTIWVDADILVFDAEGFSVDVQHNCAFCREIWAGPADDGTLQLSTRVNNSVSVFTRESTLLDFYIEACQLLARHKSGPIDRLDLGTTFLGRLHTIAYFPLLTNVGMLSPWLIREIATERDDLVKLYMQASIFPVYATNLCASLVGEKGHKEAEVIKAIARLLTGQGDLLNRFCRKGSAKL